MQTLTLRIIQGADRGRVFTELRPPITIGREEGNSIQLNDERISRFHLKIQENNGYLVLTDLDSTNGTKINGQECQIRNLRYGDIISVGRSVLLYGTREQIANRIEVSNSSSTDMKEASKFQNGELDDIDFDLSTGIASSYRNIVLKLSQPGLPSGLEPSQSAQLSELFEYFHAQIGSVVEAARYDEKAENATAMIDEATWHIMINLHAKFAELIRRVGDPTLGNTDGEFGTSAI